jgi:hypothetical protein
MTKNMKLQLFNFKNSLSMDQQDVSQIVEAHLGFCDQYSELEVYGSLNQRLSPYTYYDSVKGLLEGMAAEFNSDQLLYELKDAYRKIERKNQGNIYRHPMDVLLNVINAGDSATRMDKIVNELAMYDWVPEIKSIMWKVSTRPTDRQNYSSNGGRGDVVRTIAQAVPEGHIAFLENRWFLVKSDSIEVTMLESHVQDQEQLRKLRLLEEAVKRAEIGADRINFHLSEGLTLGLSTKNPGKLYLNDVEAEKETTLETLFQSPIVPYIQRGFYPVIGEALENMSKIVELDIVTRVHNPLRPALEAYAFNYGEGNYLYHVDKRTGATLMKYESASQLIEDVMRSLDYDLTPFYAAKVPKEVKTKRALEEAEKVVTERLAQVDDAILTLDQETDINEMAEVVEARAEFLTEKASLLTQLEEVRIAKNHQVARNVAGAVQESASPTASSIDALAQEIWAAFQVNPAVPQYIEEAQASGAGDFDRVVELLMSLADPQDQAARPGPEKEVQNRIAMYMQELGAAHFDDFYGMDVQGGGTLYDKVQEVVYHNLAPNPTTPQADLGA